MEIIRKFRANFNSFDEVLLFIRIFLFITILPLLIGFLTLPQLMKVLTRRVAIASQHLNDDGYKDKVVKYTDYILIRNFWIYKNTCLKRSLALYYYLHKVVPDIHICFGVRLQKEADDRDRGKGLDGHAWLLHSGEIFLESNEDITRTYTVTYCFPESLKNAKNS